MPRNPNKSDWSGGLPACIASFSVIEDPRTGGNKLHHFGEVLFMTVSAMLCGMNCFSDIEDFCDLQIDWLRKWIKMPNGVPRAQTFSNIFAIIEPDLFNRCLAEHIGALHPTLKRQIIAIDGKRLRGSHGLDTEACHVVSDWAAESGLTLAQEYVADKSNEITAIPHLIQVLALSGQIISLDEPASAFQSHIRQHCSIENSCHWVLDTAFREDHNQTYIGHAAKNLGALRRIVLNLLKIDLTDTRSLPKKRRRALLDLNYRNSLLSLVLLS